MHNYTVKLLIALATEIILRDGSLIWLQQWPHSLSFIITIVSMRLWLRPVCVAGGRHLWPNLVPMPYCRAVHTVIKWLFVPHLHIFRTSHVKQKWCKF